MEIKYLVLAIAVAMLVIAVGCTKYQPAQESVSPQVGNVFGEIYELDAVDESVQVEDLDVNPDELSGLDF